MSSAGFLVAGLAQQDDRRSRGPGPQHQAPCGGQIDFGGMAVDLDQAEGSSVRGCRDFTCGPQRLFTAVGMNADEISGAKIEDLKAGPVKRTVFTASVTVTDPEDRRQGSRLSDRLRRFVLHCRLPRFTLLLAACHDETERKGKSGACGCGKTGFNAHFVQGIDRDAGMVCRVQRPVDFGNAERHSNRFRHGRLTGRTCHVDAWPDVCVDGAFPARRQLLQLCLQYGAIAFSFFRLCAHPARPYRPTPILRPTLSRRIGDWFHPYSVLPMIGRIAGIGRVAGLNPEKDNSRQSAETALPALFSAAFRNTDEFLKPNVLILFYYGFRKSR